MRVPERITVEWLRRRGACDAAIAKFNRLFPRGARITLANLRRARRYGFDVQWLVIKLGVGHHGAVDNCPRCSDDVALLAKALRVPRR